MFRSLNIVYKLFKTPLLISGVMFCITLLLFLSIIGLKDAYMLNLQNEFATKQPHIKVIFTDDNIQKTKEQIKKDINYLKTLSPLISNIAPFTSSEGFFTTLAFKEGGDAFYNGNIKIIGLGSDEMVYDFFSSSFVNRKPFEIPYTPLEFLYTFKNENNIMIYNSALFNSFFPVIESVEEFKISNEQNTHKGKLSAVFNDYDKQPIIYTGIDFANKLLSNKHNKISGYYINASSLETIDRLTKELKRTLPKDRFSVTSWLEEREKQFMMFHIFESLSFIIVFIILLISILFILLLIYNAIIKKSYQLSVLLTLGYKLDKEIFISIFITIAVFSSFSFFITNEYLPLIADTMKIELSNTFIYNILSYIAILDLIFFIISYLLIKSAYKLKATSVF